MISRRFAMRLRQTASSHSGPKPISRGVRAPQLKTILLSLHPRSKQLQQGLGSAKALCACSDGARRHLSRIACLR